jgi:ABC transport system ATP-binding/permease protein
MWKLVIEDDEGKRTVVPLTREAYTVGRKEGNAIRLTERNVSRDHAKLRRKSVGGASAERSGFFLDDVSSYNGVYVNGLRVATEHELAHGDLIQIGDYRVVLQDDTVVDSPAISISSADLKATIPGHSAARSQAAQLLERPNRLVMLAGPTPGAEYPLDSERMMSIGRAEDASISINHNSVSRLHCEVHALGDGRFEIVDKGSSNGVRVNASELRRGIIEANDIIELGDVKFKFIGAGQVFRPGATESQQLAAIGDRTASTIVASKRAGGALPYVVFGAIVAAGAVGAWVVTRPRPEALLVPATVSAAPETMEQGVVFEAKKLFEGGEIEASFEKLRSELPEGSLFRSSPDAMRIAAAWADRTLERGLSEPDLARRRQLLESIAKSTFVDPERRKLASDKIIALDEFEKPLQPGDSPTAPREAGAATTDASTGLAIAPRRPAPAVTVSTTTSTSTIVRDAGPPKTIASSSSDMDRVRPLMTQGAAGLDAARAILEKKVFGNRAAPEEINALKAVCKGQGDKVCIERCKALLNP